MFPYGNKPARSVPPQKDETQNAITFKHTHTHTHTHEETFTRTHTDRQQSLSFFPS